MLTGGRERVSNNDDDKMNKNNQDIEKNTKNSVKQNGIELKDTKAKELPTATIIDPEKLKGVSYIPVHINEGFEKDKF